VHRNDVTVYQAAGTSFGTGGIDMNAWELSRDPQVPGYAQLGVAPPGWPSTSVRSTAAPSSPPNAPRYNIVDFTQRANPANPHGTLFVNDLLRNYALVTGAYTPDSEHDFRLSPMVSDVMPLQTPTARNPLVDLGLDDSFGWPIALRNSNSTYEGLVPPTRRRVAPTLTRRPGLTLPSSTPLHNPPMNAWDWDAEGFGNPRIANRSGFPITIPGVTSYSQMDLGADEMGELIIAGYIDGTTIFSRNVPNASGITDHTGIFFVELAGLMTPRNRPQTALWIGSQGDMVEPNADQSLRNGPSIQLHTRDPRISSLQPDDRPQQYRPLHAQPLLRLQPASEL
jgi:hypothetical protein